MRVTIKYLELNENKNTIYLSLWNTVRAGIKNLKQKRKKSQMNK